MKKALVFLNGTYPDGKLEFYAKEISDNKHALIVSVDGATAVFDKIGKKPSIILGDLDSIDEAVKKAFAEIEVLRYPQQKDCTDGELALNYCLEKGCDEIIMYGGIDTSFETDHLLGNLFLMHQAIEFSKRSGREIKIKMRDFSQEIYVVNDTVLLIKGCCGDRVSVIPLSQEVELSYSGLEYPMEKEKAYFGSSRTLSNTMISDKASIHVKGIALVVRHFHAALRE